MHREQLVERIRRDERAVRLRELTADDQRLEAADQEEGERGDAVQDADPLVIDGGEPAPEAGPRPLHSHLSFVAQNCG